MAATPAGADTSQPHRGSEKQDADDSSAAGGSARRRRRRRKGKAANDSEDSAATKTASPSSGAAPRSEGSGKGSGPKQKRRRRRARSKAEPTPVELVERAGKNDAPSLLPSSVDTPLEPAEVAEVKRHLRFLKDYKRTLKLKLNAQEDLLLNGAKEPSSRGVCHHLLSKVDYALVAAAASRMEKEDRPRLLAGVLGFKSELQFLLLYLECLEEAAHDDATAALEQALERIDFSSVSEGQMRRVLELIVELFDEAQRARLMLGLLESKTFRGAFEQSLPKLPEALAKIVAPLGAVHSVVLKGKRSSADGAALRDGVRLLLNGNGDGFRRRPAPVRGRLFRHAINLLPDATGTHSRALENLLSTFEKDSPQRRRMEFAWIRRLLETGSDRRASRRLKSYVENYPDDAQAKSLGEALAAPRVGRIAALGRATEAKAQHLNPALHLTQLRELWLRVGTAAEADAVERHVLTTRDLILPCVTRLAESGTHEGRPFVAYAREGELLHRNHPALRGFARSLALTSQLWSIAAALHAVGVQLPDSNIRRFEINEDGRVRLVNLWGLERRETEETEQTAIERAKADLIPDRLGDETRRDLASATTFAAVLNRLDAARWEERSSASSQGSFSDP